MKEKNALKIYFDEIKGYEELTLEEEIKYIKKAKGGDNEAIDILFKANAKYVVSVAKKYQGGGLDLEDLIQEGNIGVLEAISKYDLNKNVKFNLYAVWRIKKNIFLAIYNKGREIRLPIHKSIELNKIENIMGNCTKGSLNENLLEVQNETGFSQKKINSLYNLPSGKTSLDIEVGGESLVNLIPSKEISQENLWKKELNKDIMNCLKTLSQDEKTIIVNSYGLGDNEPLLLREIGKILRISAEAVRQKKEEILKRLKLKKYSEPFEDYFYNQ